MRFWGIVKFTLPASEMMHTVSGGALNSTQSKFTLVHFLLRTELYLP